MSALVTLYNNSLNFIIKITKLLVNNRHKKVPLKKSSMVQQFMKWFEKGEEEGEREE